jgi:hypothetical protein
VDAISLPVVVSKTRTSLGSLWSMSTVQSGDRLTVCELKTSGRMPCNSNSAKSVPYYIYDAKEKRKKYPVSFIQRYFWEP